MDYSIYPKNQKQYTGSEEKIGITINSIDYIVKFQKNSENGLLNNHISEHLGSSIFNILGEAAQETHLGIYNQRNVVVCMDFNQPNNIFVPFNGVGESSLEQDKELYKYSYSDIILMLKEKIKITSLEQTIEKFWNMYIIDALIGNFDRHGANWGFMKSNNRYNFALIFDNGSSLFPRRNTDDLMQEVLDNEEIIKNMTYTYPTSQIRLNDSKSSYFEVINSLEFDECNKALERVYLKIDLETINNFIDAQEVLSKLQKEFYKYIIFYRFEKIIKASYIKLKERKT